MRLDSEGLQALVTKVLGIHEDVRFAALFDSDGRKLGGGMRKGKRSLDPPKKSSQIDKASALYPALLAANERYFGKFGFMFAKMERCNAIVVQVEAEVFLVVTTDPPTGLDIIPEIEKVVGGRRR